MNTTQHAAMKALTILAFSLTTAAFAGNGPGEAHATTARMVRREAVAADYRTVERGAAFERTVFATAHGYHVEVKGPDGALLMKGDYRDTDATIAHGYFIYYHTNGRVESEGACVDGRKTGVWLRNDRDGRPLAERVYAGMSYAQMAEHYGWNSAERK